MADVHNIAYQDKFTSVPLDSGQLEGKGGKIKVPRRVLHFSDGTLEEYSTDEEDCVDSQPTTVVDPKSLTWMPWCVYYMTSAARMSISIAELCGEKIAWVLGITSPKYGYAIEEYKRVKKHVDEEKENANKLQEQAQVNSAFDVTVVSDKSQNKSTTASAQVEEAADNKY